MYGSFGGIALWNVWFANKATIQDHISMAKMLYSAKRLSYEKQKRRACEKDCRYLWCELFLDAAKRIYVESRVLRRLILAEHYICVLVNRSKADRQFPCERGHLHFDYCLCFRKIPYSATSSYVKSFLAVNGGLLLRHTLRCIPRG